MPLFIDHEMNSLLKSCDISQVGGCHHWKVSTRKYNLVAVIAKHKTYCYKIISLEDTLKYDFLTRIEGMHRRQLLGVISQAQTSGCLV